MLTLATVPIFSAYADLTPPHNIIAARVNVLQNDTGNLTTSVTMSLSYTIGDFELRTGSNRGDYNVQIGPDATDDASTGLLMSSVDENGRDNGDTAGGASNVIYCVSMIDPTTGPYLIDINTAGGLAGGANPEYNVNVAAAWFPYTNWIGGLAKNTANGGALTVFTGSPGLVLGTHFVDNGSGKSVVNLTGFGIDSRTDGILIVNGAKNESANFALSQPNTTNGTWNVILRDTGNTGAGGEQDPVAFVYIPRTNKTVISGRFLGDGSIAMFSGSSPQFTVTNFGIGQYELKIPGRSPADGVLIISPEGGGATNFDNIVNYQVNAAGDGWEIQSRDTPNATTGLESPGPTEGVVSFVYIPGPSAGFSVIPTNNLLTSESGGTATFTVALHKQPTNDVMINVSSSNPAEGTVTPTLLTFTTNDWNVPQTVTITGQDDAVVDGAVAYTIILAPASSADLTYNGLNPSDVSVVNTDNEGGITVAPTSGLNTTEAGGAATFAIHLNTQPSGDVTIGLSSSDTTEGTLSTSALTFTTANWNQDQTVIITGVDDGVDDGDIAYTIITAPATSSDPAYNGLNPANVSVVNIDNDTAGVNVSASGPAGITVVEGGTTNYTVVLTSEPSANVTLAVASSDTTQGGTVAPATLTFTPTTWFTLQTVTITGINDTVVDGNTPFTVTNTITSTDPLYSTNPPIIVLVTTLDNEAVITLPSGDLIYGIGFAGVGIDGRATIVDTNSPTYNGGTLTVTLTANGTADDRLEIRNVGAGAGQISVSGNTISYGGIPIGTFSGGVGTTPLAITFNSSSTPTAGEALLRSITFRNVGSNPSLNRRAVSVVLVDGDGGTSSATTGIRVGLLRSADFQEGADHGYGLYSGEADIQLQESSPNTNFPAGGNSGLFIDLPDAGVHNAFHTLMRFDNIFGNGFGQVPTNAIIVSADLILHVNDQGDGTPLYHMLRSWDATNETWTSMGNGVDLDVDASSAFTSQIGLLDGSGTTGLGSVSVSVTPDIMAWQAGESNYGWAMIGWVGSANTDGTGVSPSEAVNLSDRPYLHVLWVPAGTASASFRQGVNGYINSLDTRIRENSPDVNYSTVATVFSDWAVSGTNDNEQVLFRFDNIVGNAPGQIPAGARIDAAMVDLASVGNNAMGAGGRFFALLIPWDDTNATWNTWTNGIQADGIEAATTATASAGSAALTPLVQGGYHTYELTTDVQSWVSGTRANYGWAILPWVNGTDGWGIGTAESTGETNRPQLRVYYTPGVANIVLSSIIRTATTVVLRFSGAVGTTYSILRAGVVAGPYPSIGTATVGQDGTATFTDNAPLPNAAFYRVSSP